MTDSAFPSLSTATFLDKALAIGYGKKVILGRFSAVGADASPCVDTTIMKDDEDMVRAVSFLSIPDGPLCLVSAGDAKKINVFNISSSEEYKDKSVPPTTPCYSFGPHAKRITHLTTSSEGVIVFADKFGEVYRLRLCWSPQHHIEPDGNSTSPAVFLLQHFSFFSCVFLSSPVPRIEGISSTEERDHIFCRRLFTCDKDCHTRCSRFPEAYIIEQYLWRKRPVGQAIASSDSSSPPPLQRQSVVTAMIEIPAAGSLCHSSREGNTPIPSPKKNDGTSTPLATPSPSSVVETAAGGLDLPLSSLNAHPSHQQDCLDWNSYYVLGHHDGCISFWKARNDLQCNDAHCSLEEISMYVPPSPVPLPSDSTSTAAVGEGSGGVVGLSYVIASAHQTGYPRHPDDAVRGVFAAHDRSCHVVFIPLLDSSTNAGDHLHVVLSKVRKVELPHPVVALRRCSVNTAVAITRASTIHFVELMLSSEVTKQKDMEAQEWNVCLRADYKMEGMRSALHRIVLDERPGRTSDAGESVKGMGAKAAAGKGEDGKSKINAKKNKGKEEDVEESGMETLDLWAQWQNEVMDPRKRKREENDEDEDGKEEENDRARKTKK